MSLPERPTIPEKESSCARTVGNVDKVYAKIQAALFRLGFNLWEIFRRLDDQGTNFVSEPTFLRVFLGPMKTIIGLNHSDIEILLRNSKVDDGRVAYDSLLRTVYGRLIPFGQTEQDRELEMKRPNTLSPNEEEYVRMLLSIFSIEIAPSDPLTTLDDMRTLFKVYDRAGSGLVSRDGFVNILNRLSAPFTSSDIALLIRRYCHDLYSVKYEALLKELQQVTKYLKDNDIVNANGTFREDVFASIPRIPDINKTSVLQGDFIGIDKIRNKDYSQALAMETSVAFNKIKEQVYKEQLRVHHFFIHYDRKETGRVNSQAMHKCISWISISETCFNDLYLTEREVHLLLKVYQDPFFLDSYIWKVFQADLERDIDSSELASWQQKSLCRKSADPFKVLYRPRTRPPERKELTIQDVLHHINENMETLDQAGMLFAEMGKADIRKTHYLTPQQFECVLIKCNISLSREEHEILRERYGDKNSIDWRRFADELKTLRGNHTVGCEIQESQGKKKSLDDENEQILALRESNIIEILGKIKNVLVCNREWIKDYLKEYDTSEKNVITKADFEEGLSRCGITLSRKEIDVVLDVFCNPSNPGEVEYTRLCRVVDEDSLPPCPMKPTLEESINRAKMLPKKIDREQPTHQWANFKQRKALEKSMDRLSKYIGVANTDYYKGLDENNSGTISSSVFQKSLLTLNCLEVLSNPEVDNLIHCFGIKKGAFLELDYMSFLKALDIIVKTKAAANSR